MLKQWLPVAFKGSRYAERLPIGTDTSIMAVTPAKLRAFYRDWYRPDLMAVVAVGDFDPANIESLIKKHFSRIQKPSNAPRRVMYEVPGNTAPLIAIASDREATNSNLTLAFKMPSSDIKTVGDYRQALAERLYLRMLNSRLSEIAQKPDAPFLGASASKDRFIARTGDAFALSAGVKDGGLERGLEALLTEARRVDEFGFLQSELDRAKLATLRQYERSYAERDKTESSSYVNEYVGHFLENETIPGTEYEYRLANQLVPTITLAEINSMARKWITDENRVLIAQSPIKEGVTVPTERDMLAVFDRAAKVPLTAYVETLSDEALLAKVPAPGKVVSERAITSIGATEWKLSNGARVIFKPTDFKADEVLFSAYSNGGHSLAPDSLFMSAAYASQVIQLSGLGKFNRVDLTKKLSGKSVTVSPSIGGTTEGLSGRASPKDLETLFQLAYLHFVSPRLDSAAFTAFQNQAAAFIANRGASPEQVFGDTIQVTMAQGDFRSRPLTPAVFSELRPDRSLAFYKDRFADASDFTFVFVGNTDPATLRPLVEQYLATLPSTNRKETYKPFGQPAPRGIIQKTVRKGTESKAMTVISFTGACAYTPENRVVLSGMTQLFQMRLTETLREKLGGTYSPSVSGSCARLPRQEYVVTVRYGSSPENVEQLTNAVMSLVDSLQRTPASASDLERVKEQILRTREVQLKENSYWLSSIVTREQAGEELGGMLAPYDDAVKKLTAAQLQAAAKQYLDKKNYARFVLLPEEPRTTP
jgi:zinc protease